MRNPDSPMPPHTPKGYQIKELIARKVIWLDPRTIRGRHGPDCVEYHETYKPQKEHESKAEKERKVLINTQNKTIDEILKGIK